jgi:fatty-acyl-CoA synthase
MNDQAATAEAERALRAHPAVLDCVAVITPDAHGEQRLTAVVQLRPGKHAPLDELARYLKDKNIKITGPKHVEVWPDLPRSPTGAISATEVLRQLGAS